jgi:hypothetical protein
MAAPAYRITDLNVVGGSGMVADRDISKSEIILEEDALVNIDTTVTRDQWDRDADDFYEREGMGRGGTRRIYESLRRIQNNNRNDFRGLYRGPPVPNLSQRRQDVNTVKYNAFAFDNPRTNHVSLFVGRDLSRVNHSCVPNAYLTEPWTLPTPAAPAPDQLGRQKLIASKHISVNEEITLEFLTDDDFWLNPAATRQDNLAHWGFICSCEACRDSHLFDPTWAFSRTIRTELYQPLPAVAQVDIIKRRIHIADTYIRILEHNGFSGLRLTKA